MAIFASDTMISNAADCRSYSSCFGFSQRQSSAPSKTPAIEATIGCPGLRMRILPSVASYYSLWLAELWV